MKRYFFNREERFFCSLIMCLLQDNPKLATEIIPNIHSVESKDFEVYVETSIIRDYWMSFGKPKTNEKTELNKSRSKYLKELCAFLQIDFKKLSERSYFYSKNSYIQSPGNWKNLKQDDLIGKKFRAFFKMKQDILTETPQKIGTSKQQRKDNL